MPARVSMALRMSFAARTAFFGVLPSNEYTKTLVSRKNLSLIHLVPAEAPPCLHVLEPFHKRVELLGVAGFRRQSFQPLAKKCIQRFVLRFSQQPRLFDQLLIRA